MFHLAYTITGQPKVSLYCETVAQCVESFERHRDGTDAAGKFTGLDFGSSEMQTQAIIKRDGQFVARISYNGRLWNQDGTEQKIFATQATADLATARIGADFDRALAIITGGE